MLTMLARNLLVNARARMRSAFVFAALVTCAACDRDVPPEREEPLKVELPPTDCVLSPSPHESLERAKLFAGRVWAKSLLGPAPCEVVKDPEERDWVMRPGEERDQWGRLFGLVCVGEDVEVRSNGPDGRPSTEDDVRVVASRSGVSVLPKSGTAVGSSSARGDEK